MDTIKNCNVFALGRLIGTASSIYLKRPNGVRVERGFYPAPDVNIPECQFLALNYEAGTFEWHSHGQSGSVDMLECLRDVPRTTQSGV